MMLHCRLKAPEAWERHKAEIVGSVTVAPFLTRNWFGSAPYT
jgi:hypothetical protein